ncbi:putative endonuclease lcl3 [Sorochytrium milnesiophthora]
MVGDNTLFKRFPTAKHITPDDLRKTPLRLRGIVTSVGDSDGFRFYHVPTMRSLLSLPKKLTSADTISVRLAGVDCPEAAHFGNPAQPYSYEAYAFAMACLMPDVPVKASAKFLAGDPKNKAAATKASPVKGKGKGKAASSSGDDDNDHGRKHPPRGTEVMLEIYRTDQYDRAVAMVYYRPYKMMPFYYKNLSMELLRAGLAVIYSQSGAEYGGYLEEFKKVEAKAKQKKLGMWRLPKSAFVSPADYKKAHKTSS